MKKLTATSSTSPKVLNLLLKKYGVTVEENEFGYLTFTYPIDGKEFAELFLKTMRYLLGKKIYVTVLDIVVSKRVYKETAYLFDSENMWLNEEQGESQPYNNYLHSREEYLDALYNI